MNSLARPLRDSITRPVIGMLNDGPPIVARGDGLFAAGAVARRVHGDVGAMMVGGVAGLLMQMLHPAALAGVWDHSNFRGDMSGRLRRTSRFIAVTTYGGRDEAEAAITRVRDIHARVTGTLPGGAPYSADDPAVLAWVHVAGASCFLAAWRRYAEPGMSARDQDAYWAETAVVAEALGADPAPRSARDAAAFIAGMRPRLRCDERARGVARVVLSQPAETVLMEPLQRLVLQAGVDLLPGWARRMHGLGNPLLGRPLVRASALGVARTLRWAFAGGR